MMLKHYWCSEQELRPKDAGGCDAIRESRIASPHAYAACRDRGHNAAEEGDLANYFREAVDARISSSRS